MSIKYHTAPLILNKSIEINGIPEMFIGTEEVNFDSSETSPTARKLEFLGGEGLIRISSNPLSRC